MTTFLKTPSLQFFYSFLLLIHYKVLLYDDVFGYGILQPYLSSYIIMRYISLEPRRHNQ